MRARVLFQATASVANQLKESKAKVKQLEQDRDDLRADVLTLEKAVFELQDKMETAEATIDELRAAPPLPAPSTGAGQGCTGNGAAKLKCPPEVEGVGTGLALRAKGGKVTFESDACDTTDLCDLARKIDALFGKFA